MREIYRQFLAPQATPGLQTVWIARQNAARTAFAELKRDMLALSAKAGWQHPAPPAGGTH
jgi:RNase P protein component